MNKHIELPIAGNTFGTFTATFTGATLPVSQNVSLPTTFSAAVFCASETDTITHIGFPFAAATGAAAKTFRMELRNVNSDGSPGSTIYANSATLAHTVIGTTYTTATTTNPVVAQIPLITPYQITRGSLYAVCAVPIGGTWSGVSYMNLVQSYGALPASMNQTNLPYLYTNPNNIPTRNSSPIFLLVSSTKFYGAVGPYLQLVSIANTSTAYGNFFTLPASFGTSVRLSGLKFPINTFTKAGVDTYNIKVYSGTGTTLYVNDTFDMDVNQNVSPVSNMFVHQFDTTVTLYPGVKYFIGFATPSGDTISFNCQRLENYPEDFDKVRKMNTGGLIDFEAGLITSAGSVAVTDAYYFPFNPLIDLIDPAPSAGGASTTAVFNQGLFN